MKAPLNNLSHSNRCRWFLKHRAGIKRISTFNEKTRCFETWYIGTIGGKIVCNKDGYKFSTRDMARQCTKDFKESCRVYLAGG